MPSGTRRSPACCVSTSDSRRARLPVLDPAAYGTAEPVLLHRVVVLLDQNPVAVSEQAKRHCANMFGIQ